MAQEDPLIRQYFCEIKTASGLTVQEEAAVWRRIQQGEVKAMAELVRQNLCFVVAVAKHYQGMGLPFADLIAEGNLGLVTAAQRFDGSRGLKFISYAVWWIRHAILKALAAQGRSVRLPASRVAGLSRLGKALSRLEQELNRAPVLYELAAAMDVEPEDVRLLLELDRPNVALEEPLGEEMGGRCLHEMIPDESQVAGDEQLLHGELQQEVRRAMDTLSEVEAQVLRMYFGLEGHQPMTLDQIGTRFRRSRERMRQIKARALEKLRHPSRGETLREYLA